VHTTKQKEEERKKPEEQEGMPQNLQAQTQE
jgi:hypothetical protein